MTRFKTFSALTLLLAVLLTACGTPAPAPTSAPTAAPAGAPAGEVRDFAGELEPDMSSDTAKLPVTVHAFIDGDTVHFDVPADVMPDGVLKARFLAVNTPESTGKIEEYGKTAAEFTKARLSSATDILIESETDGWDPDSTGGRYLVWVWYRTEDGADYRNLNAELLQNGLAAPNSAAGNRYGSTCVAALEQARVQKLNLYSGQPAPDFYYGEAVELTLRELRANIAAYDGMKVAFTGTVTANSGAQGVWVESCDAETGLYFGIYVYYGHSLSGPGLEALAVGNEARIVGTVQYYAAGGVWQISDISYRLMKPDDPRNVRKLSDGHSPAYPVTDADTFVNGTVTVQTQEGTATLPYAEAVLGASIELRGLTVLSVHTSENGAMTLTCEADGIPITVRTGSLTDGTGAPVTADAYLGKTVTVKGIVDFFGEAYQIRVFAAEHITIQE